MTGTALPVIDTGCSDAPVLKERGQRECENHSLSLNPQDDDEGGHQRRQLKNAACRTVIPVQLLLDGEKRLRGECRLSRPLQQMRQGNAGAYAYQDKADKSGDVQRSKIFTAKIVRQNGPGWAAGQRVACRWPAPA